MRTLLKTLEMIKGVIDVPHEILEELPKYASKFPLETMQVLSFIARAEREYHEISYKQAEYKEVIKAVKASGHAEAIKIADELLNHFGSRGFVDDFRDLL